MPTFTAGAVTFAEVSGVATDAQIPTAYLKDGSRILTGNLTIEKVTPLILIKGTGGTRGALHWFDAGTPQFCLVDTGGDLHYYDRIGSANRIKFVKANGDIEMGMNAVNSANGLIKLDALADMLAAQLPSGDRTVVIVDYIGDNGISQDINSGLSDIDGILIIPRLGIPIVGHLKTIGNPATGGVQIDGTGLGYDDTYFDAAFSGGHFFVSDDGTDSHPNANGANYTVFVWGTL